MKIVQLNPGETAESILSTDPRKRNQAFKALYMSPVVAGKVRDWAKTYNLSGKTPDDVIQEGIILLDELARNGRFRGESKAETFLLGICKNLIRDSAKKVKRVVFKESLSDADLNSEDSVADHMVLEELEDAGQRRDQALQEALGQLTDKCRDALKLYYFENKSMADVAASRGLANPDQAKKAVFRCRESLRELIHNNPFLHNILNPKS